MNQIYNTAYLWESGYILPQVKITNPLYLPINIYILRWFILLITKKAHFHRFCTCPLLLNLKNCTHFKNLGICAYVNLSQIDQIRLSYLFIFCFILPIPKSSVVISHQYVMNNGQWHHAFICVSSSLGMARHQPPIFPYLFSFPLEYNTLFLLWRGHYCCYR